MKRFLSLSHALLSVAALCCSFSVAKAGLIAGFYNFTPVSGRDSIPNLQTPGVAATVGLGRFSPVLVPAISAGITIGGGSPDRTYGSEGTTGSGDNGINGYIRHLSGSDFGTFAFLELTNTSSLPLLISKVVFDLTNLVLGPSANLLVQWTRRSATYAPLSPTGSATFASPLPERTWGDYTASITGITLAPTEKLLVFFDKPSSAFAIFGIDNIAVDGAFALTAVPETSTLLGLGAFFGLASSARFRRRPGAAVTA